MSKRFSKIYIEITNNCNLNCSFCSKDNLPKKEMHIDDFDTIIKKIKDYTDSIYLHVKGEPLLHSKLDDILSICDKYHMKVCITTNGTLLLKKKDILLKHHIKQINISLHSENRVNNYFETVFLSCDDLSSKTNIIYRIWTLPTLNLDKISTNIVDKINDHYHLSKEVQEKILHDKNIKIKDKIYLDKDYEFIWPEINDTKCNLGTCLGTRSHIAILVDGTVVPCCLDSSGVIKLGNIFSDKMDDIINSELFKRINRGFQNNKIEADLCKSCTYRYRFNKE